MKRRTLLQLSAAATLLPILPAVAQEDLKALAREAYIYAYPLVKNYLTMYQYALEPGGAQYKGPLNTLVNVARVYTPEDTAIITPNSDTPYSFIVFDLRAEPVVVTMPEIEAERYYSLQIVDLYTNNVDYLGTRKDGNAGGDFLIAGPGWTGEPPEGIRRVVKMPTDLAMGLMRTQLFSPEDLPRVEEIQKDYAAAPLSVYAGTAAPPAAAAVDWPPVSDALMETDFWPLAGFLLQFAPPWPGDEALRDRLGALGMEEDAAWPPKDLPAETVAMMGEVARTTYDEIRDTAGAMTDSSEFFGTPEEMQGRYMSRAAAAQGGIYGNSAEEALYVINAVDADKAPLDGATGAYTLTFAPGALPPVDAFWSITMYDRARQLLVDNPIDRYLINSAMLDSLKPNDAGEIVIYIQKESPGAGRESNWLPAPSEPFYMVTRLYLPRPEALERRWVLPAVEKAE
ncbi:MAG: DUF1254 domain-containing protein [Rhodobacterales bacterium]|nr:DUF1254 domain-containing protein [Rhodobacterales bacterium]